MAYDIAFRFQQALDPSALTTLPNCLHALSAAIEDCRNAGKPSESDPAVILLARHLGAFAASVGGPDVLLRRQCMDMIADLRRKPALLPLAHKGVAYPARPSPSRTRNGAGAAGCLKEIHHGNHCFPFANDDTPALDAAG